ncbi:MAG TPA: TonB-dependent receptor [Sphingomicrobium sp.]|nr:TonB-dependent receptor [Sphingomicrobium sp.]
MKLSLVFLAAAAAQADAGPPPTDAAREIVVTGERVRRTVRDTASSVEVIGSDAIRASSADRVEQLLQLVPNVQLGNGSQGPAIRGLDTTGALFALPAFLGGNRPRTTLVVDGRRTTYNEFVFGAAPAWDVDRVEIFRSPQTTTQGHNSIAGAIFVHSNDPTFEPEYRARIIGGNHHLRAASAVASGAFSRDVAVRLSGDVRYQRTTSRIADRIVGGDPNHDVHGTARAKLLVRPRGLPDSRLLLTYTHNESQAPQIVGLTAPFRKRRDASGFYGTFRIRADALTAAAEHLIANDLRASIIVTAGDSRTRRLAFPGLGQAHVRGRDWSGEAVLNWSPEGPLKAIGGVSRSHLVLRQRIDLSRLSGIGRFHDEQDSLGLFGEANWTVAQRATLTVGLRYQQDRQERHGVLGTNSGGIPLDYDRTFRAWLPKLSLAYDFSPGLRAGLLVQKAYNPGGTTLRFDTGLPDNFDAETLWDYELFARARIGSDVRVSANVFHYAMRNAQRSKAITILAPGGFPVGFADLFNAPKARSRGAEAEIDWRAGKRLTARVSVGLLRTKLVDAGPDYPAFKGNEFARSPRLSTAATLDWHATERLRLSAQARYRSRYFADDVNSADVRVPRAAIVNARAEYRIGQVTAFAYARNLFDRFALLDRNGNISASAEDPRMVGIGIESRF